MDTIFMLSERNGHRFISKCSVFHPEANDKSWLERGYILSKNTFEKTLRFVKTSPNKEQKCLTVEEAVNIFNEA